MRRFLNEFLEIFWSLLSHDFHYEFSFFRWRDQSLSSDICWMRGLSYHVNHRLWKLYSLTNKWTLLLDERVLSRNMVPRLLLDSKWLHEHTTLNQIIWMLVWELRHISSLRLLNRCRDKLAGWKATWYTIKYWPEDRASSSSIWIILLTSFNCMDISHFLEGLGYLTWSSFVHIPKHFYRGISRIASM